MRWVGILKCAPTEVRKVKGGWVGVVSVHIAWAYDDVAGYPTCLGIEMHSRTLLQV